MALVGHTCVDKYEGSLVEMHSDGTETSFSPFQTPEGHDVRAVSKPRVTPQAHISMNDAQRACKASGKRLCRAHEWKAACRGPNRTRYPYGDYRRANACVDTGRTSPTRVLYSGERSPRTMNDPRLNQLDNTVESTGTAAACTNEYGVHDMVGNVHEWADDGAFHGGYYLDTVQNGEGCDYTTTAHSKSYYDYSTGFRCCADEGTLFEEVEEQQAPPAHARANETPDGATPWGAAALASAAPLGTHDNEAPLVRSATEVSDRRSVSPPPEAVQEIAT